MDATALFKNNIFSSPILCQKKFPVFGKYFFYFEQISLIHKEFIRVNPF